MVLGSALRSGHLVGLRCDARRGEAGSSGAAGGEGSEGISGSAMQGGCWWGQTGVEVSLWAGAWKLGRGSRETRDARPDPEACALRDAEGAGARCSEWRQAAWLVFHVRSFPAHTT